MDNACQTQEKFFFFKKKESWDMQSLAKMYSFNGRGIWRLTHENERAYSAQKMSTLTMGTNG